MSKAPYFDKNGLKKGPWSEDEDNKLRAYIKRYGHWNWRELPRFAGVSRCGKSCRLRWMNYLRPNIKHGNFTKEEEGVIMELHNKIGNKWSAIAAKLPGRSDNEIKNYWNTHLRKRAKQDKEVLKIVHDGTLESPQANPKEIPIKNTEYEVSNEVGVLLPTLSSESSYVDTHGYPCGAQSSESLSTSYYASVEFPSLMLSDSDCLVSSGDSIQPYGYEYVGDFWTEPFLVDRDSTMSNEDSCSDVVGGLISTTSCHDMVNSDEFFWSTMDLYSQYHNQFMK